LGESKESKELHEKVDEILSHVKSLDGQMSWLVKSQLQAMKTKLVEYLTKKKRRAAKVYLAVDGERNVKTIADYLELQNENVSIELKWLERNGLVYLQKWGIYKKDKIDKILDLTKELRKDAEFQSIE
jgi:DNA-binding MarR family transcriptional regulator